MRRDVRQSRARSGSWRHGPRAAASLGARLAWDCFEHHGRCLGEALRLGSGGARLMQLGYDDDIRAAARVAAVHLLPELRRDPLRVEIAAVGVTDSHWPLR